MTKASLEASALRPPKVSSSQSEVRALVEECAAVRHGHFVLASGRHSDVYVEKYRVLERPEVLEHVCRPLVEHFEPFGPEAIVGPQTGGVLVAFEIARQMKLPALYIERKDGEFRLARGAQLNAGTRVLLVDDVLTTGVSLKEALPVMTQAEVELVGIGVLIDRSERPLDFSCEVFAACRFEATTYAPDEIPDWLARIPISTPGTRAGKNS